jgi:hypothetical protein
MSEQPRLTLRNYRPQWEEWISEILREIDQALQNQVSLSADTVIAADKTELLAWKMFSRGSWNANLLEHLDTLETELSKEHRKEVQRALDLTQGLIREIKRVQTSPFQLLIEWLGDTGKDTEDSNIGGNSARFT